MVKAGFARQSSRMREEILNGDGGASGNASVMLNQGICWLIGSYRLSLPASRSCMMAVAVNSLVMEATL